MPASTDPIFTKNVKTPIGPLITAANTSSQGGGTIGTDIFLVGITGTTDGSFSQRIRFFPTATAPTSTTATVGRIFISSQTSGATTSANTMCIAEIALPVISADNSTSQAQYIDVPIAAGIEAGRAILATNHAAPAANTAWRAILLGFGEY